MHKNRKPAMPRSNTTVPSPLDNPISENNQNMRLKTIIGSWIKKHWFPGLELAFMNLNESKSQWWLLVTAQIWPHITV